MADLFVDGNIAQTFGPQVAESYLCRLLQVYRRSFRATNDPRWPSAFFTTQPPLAHGRPFPDTYGRPIWLLDFAIRNRGTVVRQQIWAPQNEAQRHAHAPLNMPIFFVHNDQVTLGLPISIAATRDPMTLFGAGTPASVGDCSTTFIRINGSDPPLPPPCPWRRGAGGLTGDRR